MRCFAYPLNFYYRINGLLSRNKADFFFFSIFSGQKKIYIENKGKTIISLILLFSKKKKKKKKKK